MESLYYVMSWLCHRTCPHCYEDRFRPYYGEHLASTVAESVANFPRIIANLPPRLTFFNPDEQPGRIILAGGEILLDAVREPVLYPAIQLLQSRYSAQGVRIIIQTTGDILTPTIARELAALGVHTISVSGLDAFHQGLEQPAARATLDAKCRAIVESAGLQYSSFGATPDQWIGKLWPRGRAALNHLSSAALSDNFCHQWSGGLNFLETRHAGGEVSIDPSGNVYPCCIKTRLPLGNLLTEPLLSILDRHRSNPVYQAISAGQPERMGLSHGWSVEYFHERSRQGDYQNLCIGCDAFHDEVLAPQRLVQLS